MGSRFRKGEILMPAVAAVVAVAASAAGAASAVGGVIAATFGVAAGAITTAIGGAIVGAVIGGVSAAVTGGDVLQGAIVGGVGGAFAGYAAGSAEAAASSELQMATTVPTEASLMSESTLAAEATIGTGDNATMTGKLVAEHGGDTGEIAQSAQNTFASNTVDYSGQSFDTGLVASTKDTGLLSSMAETGKGFMGKLLDSEIAAQGLVGIGQGLLSEGDAEALEDAAEKRWERERPKFSEGFGLSKVKFNPKQKREGKTETPHTSASRFQEAQANATSPTPVTPQATPPAPVKQLERERTTRISNKLINA